MGEALRVKYKLDPAAREGMDPVNLSMGAKGSRGARVSLRVTDPSGATIHRRSSELNVEQVYTSMTNTGGEYTFCFRAEDRGSGGFGLKFLARRFFQRRLFVDIKFGEEAMDDEQIMNEVQVIGVEKVTKMHMKVARLQQTANDVIKEQLYQKRRESAFRDTSESTNRRVVWLTGIQLLVVVGIGYWQMMHLKSFFIAKKLV